LGDRCSFLVCTVLLTFDFAALQLILEAMALFMKLTSDLAPFSIDPCRRTSKDNFKAKFRNKIGMKLDFPEQLQPYY
jgi:hypothetical protein